AVSKDEHDAAVVAEKDLAVHRDAGHIGSFMDTFFLIALLQEKSGGVCYIGVRDSAAYVQRRVPCMPPSTLIAANSRAVVWSKTVHPIFRRSPKQWRTSLVLTVELLVAQVARKTPLPRRNVKT